MAKTRSAVDGQYVSPLLADPATTVQETTAPLICRRFVAEREDGSYFSTGTVVLFIRQSDARRYGIPREVDCRLRKR